jgi:hypothetical protein
MGKKKSELTLHASGILGATTNYLGTMEPECFGASHLSKSDVDSQSMQCT